MDDITLALLGDSAAAERVTESGKLLRCQCGCEKQQIGIVRSNDLFGERGWKAMISCNNCFSCVTRFCKTKEKAEKEVRLAWNTRTPILTTEQIKRLEEKL